MNEMIMISILVGLIPTSILGFYMAGKFLIEKMLVRNGRIKAYFVTRNHRLRAYFVKPIGSNIKIGKKTFNFDDTTGNVLLEGFSIPVTFFNEKTSQQLDMTGKGFKSLINADHLSDMLIRAYNLGIITAQKDEKKMMTYIMIAMAISGGAFLMAFMNWQLLREFVPLMTDKINVIINLVKV